MILAIDPGPEQSAYCVYDETDGTVHEFCKVDNRLMLTIVANAPASYRLAVEMIASYGMPVGREVFETCVWIGRLIERSGTDGFELVYRKDVKMHLCGSVRAKDANVRQALIDRYGPGKGTAIGLKAAPGPLYGMSGDCWAALAVAICAAEMGA